jgi:TonB family protein
VTDAVTWGEPFRLEPRAVPAAAAAASALVHAALLVAGPRASPTVPGRPELHASRGEIAVVVSPPRRARRDREPVAAERPDHAVEAVRPRGRAALEAPLPGARAPSPAETPRAEADARDAPPRRAPPEPARSGTLGVRRARLVPGFGTPGYPLACRSARHRHGGCEGRGVYEVEVDETGRVTSVRVAESAGCPALDRSAARFFLGRARFRPAEIAGAAAPWKGPWSVRFRLEEGAEVGEGTSP